MIPKGNQRGGGQHLATHLMNSFDNDRVEILDLRGAVANDLHGAFAEWYAQSKATDCRKYLYSLSINPDHRQKSFTRGDYDDFIARVEKKLRLTHQPRAVVVHVKHGREHYHVVWSRIDGAKGKAVQMAHDHQKLRKVTQEYARDHELVLPPGMSNDRGKARFAFKAAAENLAEKQQQDRSGISKQQRREQISKIWRNSPDARSLIRNLEAAGYLLARGDQRPYVLVDLAGEVHSLSRQLTGASPKEMKARLSSLDIDKMPGVAAAQDHARKKRQGLLLDGERKQSADQKTTLADRARQTKEEAQRRRDDLAKAHAARHAALEAKKQELSKKHEVERKALAELHTAKTADIARERAARQPKGVLALLARVTGYNALTAWQQQRQDRKTGAEFKAQKDALARRHAREMENFHHRESGLTALDKRERRSLETLLRREVFNRISAPPKEQKLEPKKEQAPPLTPAQREKVADFKRAAAEITAPVLAEKHTEHEAAGGSRTQPLKPAFSEAAKAQPREGGIAAKFNDKAAPDKAPGEKKAGPDKPVPQSDAREPAPELTDVQRRALELKKAFNRRAGGHGRGERETDREHYRRPPPDYSIRR